jgi:hypothetical protein
MIFQLLKESISDMSRVPHEIFCDRIMAIKQLRECFSELKKLSKATLSDVYLTG